MRPWGRQLAVAVTAAGLLLLAATPATAEWVASLYFGDAWTQDGDVQLVQPGGTDLRFHDVSWDGESFESPVYYGMRGTRWFLRSPGWGFSVEFVHQKMVADLDARVLVEGTRSGMPVSGYERLGDTFEQLSISHGHNLLFFNGQRRWFLKKQRDKSFAGRFRPHVGLGIGVTIPHVEVNVPGSETDEYQIGDLAGQFLGGATIDLTRRLALLLEYKLTHARMELDLVGGGTLELDPVAHHLVLGLSYSIGRQGRARD